VGEPQPIEVEAFRSRFLDDVVRIHLEGLGYTLNSRLGLEHLRFLYQIMGEDKTCYVGVALDGGVPMGVVSGTLDADRLKSRVLKSMTMSQVLGIARAFARRPGLVIEWAKEAIIGSSLQYHGEQIVATLTTLAVGPQFRHRGAGRALTSALEGFFAARGVLHYRLETLVRNKEARAFYGSLGFKEAGRRAGSCVLVKKVTE
jgi:ribosomal protein S18 acetylase RimI-like enzyme